MEEPAPSRNAEPALRARVAGLTWFHRIELPDGTVTPGISENQWQLPTLELPTDMRGRTVLDVGAWDGFFSFECARRGAARVLATDSYAWQSDRFSRNEPFVLARNELGYADVVDDQLIDVMDLSPDAVGGMFDIVLFLGVLYHVRDPVTALERVCSVCRDLLVIETETAFNWLPAPAARLYPGSELAGDDTNWWALNLRSLRRLLEEQGFGDVEVKRRTSFPRRFIWAVGAPRRGRSFRRQLRSQRVVIHARRSGASRSG